MSAKVDPCQANLKTPVDTSPVLLVEDDDDTVLLIRRALQKAGVITPLQVAKSGEQAIEYLAGTGRYCDWKQFPLPSIVLLDLKMPGISGFEVLKWIRQQPGIKALRVAILTASTLQQDIKTAYDLGANIFLSKPMEASKLVELMEMLNGQWLQQAQIPAVTREFN